MRSASRSVRQRGLVVASFLVLPLLVSCAGIPPRAADRIHVAKTNLALEVLGPPPAPGSPELEKDRATVESVSSRRTVIEQATALFESTNFLLCSFAADIGPFFTSNNFSNTFVFFRHVQIATDKVTDVAKNHWHRLRPWQLYPSLPMLYPKERTFSYPSGHSTRGTVFAALLAELFPECADTILARGRQCGSHRVLIAVHFPTDVEAGRKLGLAIVRELRSDHAFQEEFAAAKKEVAAFRERAHLGPQR